MPDKNFTFEIEEHFGIISSREDGWNKELNLVRWNGASAKYDIREWDEHHEQMRRGVTLTPWEMRNLVDLFISRNNHAAVARGRAIEAERNARRIAARRKAVASAPDSEETSIIQTADNANTQMEEQQALEGAMPPYEGETERKPAATSEEPFKNQTDEQSSDLTQDQGDALGKDD